MRTSRDDSKTEENIKKLKGASTALLKEATVHFNQPTWIVPMPDPNEEPEE